jgi:hypothetical protein
MACSKTKEGEIAHRACDVGDVDLSLKNNFGVFFLNVFTTESRSHGGQGEDFLATADERRIYDPFFHLR